MKNTKTETSSFLVIGIGNSGRRDDGLGWRFLEVLESKLKNICDVEYRYQLQIEDSELVSKYELVLFVDASHSQFAKGCNLTSCVPVEYYHFSSHAQDPNTILYLTEQLYGHRPEAYLLGISGTEWELKEGLSAPGEKNLKNAVEIFNEFCKKRGLIIRTNS